MEMLALGVAALLPLAFLLCLALLLGKQRLRHLWALVRWNRAQESRPRSDDPVLRYYALGLEKGRLDEGYFPLERERTREMILRHLPAAPQVVLDVGGGAGSYALWLAGRGHEVHLVDPSPLHAQQAEEASRSTERPLASVRVGDARGLEFDDGSANAVLFLGPLYHLTEVHDRRAALGEAARVLEAGGWLFAAAISRFASMVDGLRGPVFDDDAFAAIVDRDLADGQHRNDTENPHYFTTAFFHRPDELAAEIRDAGFDLVGLHAVEGPGAFMPGFGERWRDPKSRNRLLGLLRRVESEPTLLGASPHLLAIGRKR